MSGHTKVSERELKALRALHTVWHDGEPWCLYFRSSAFTDEGLLQFEVRRAVRSLARKGLAEYQRGLFDHDGMVAGSGYSCTKAGADLIAAKRAAIARADGGGA